MSFIYILLFCIVYMKRDEFIELQKQNKSLFVVFLTASWCGPCKAIKPTVFEEMKTCTYPCYCLDIDDNMDIYSGLRAKRQIQGVPSIVVFKEGNVSFIPDFTLSGGSVEDVKSFFKKIKLCSV